MGWPDSLLRLGTCSWTADGWERAVYPPGTPRNEFIREYAQLFNSVEVDSTFYGIPRARTVDRWRDLTPNGFVFAAKAPQTITHEKFLAGCEEDLEDFLQAMDRLGDKLGPLLFQFPYFAKRRGITQDDFLARLRAFLPILPRERFQFAVEVRNKAWLGPPLFDILHAHNVACCLIDHPWMARPKQLFKSEDIFTGSFLYVRWLGDRKGIEDITTIWNEHVIDRRAQSIGIAEENGCS